MSTCEHGREIDFCLWCHDGWQQKRDEIFNSFENVPGNLCEHGFLIENCFECHFDILMSQNDNDYVVAYCEIEDIRAVEFLPTITRLVTAEGVIIEVPNKYCADCPATWAFNDTECPRCGWSKYLTSFDFLQDSDDVCAGCKEVFNRETMTPANVPDREWYLCEECAFRARCFERKEIPMLPNYEFGSYNTENSATRSVTLVTTGWMNPIYLISDRFVDTVVPGWQPLTMNGGITCYVQRPLLALPLYSGLE